MVIVLSILFGLFSGAAAVFYFLQATQRKRQVHDASEQIDMLRQTKLQHEAQLTQLERALNLAEAEDRQKTGLLDAQQNEIEWLRKELESRPRLTQKRYKIPTLGIKFADLSARRAVDTTRTVCSLTSWIGSFRKPRMTRSFSNG